MYETTRRLSSEPSFLEDGARRLEAALEKVARTVGGHIDPILAPPVAYALSTSGKRLRPILCVLAHAVARGLDPRELSDPVFDLACAVEIVHTYSLVHADLPCMDDDDMRRGRPTVHRAFNVRQATIAGAALIPAAVRVLMEAATLLGLDRDVRARIVQELTGASGSRGMVGGQLMDLDAEGSMLSADQIENIHRKKTGALLACSLRLGAISGDADADTLARLTAYGEHLGLAFQIADDVLDVEGVSERLGKAAGRDAVLRKSSYPSLFGLENARSMARQAAADAKKALGHLQSPELVDLADFVVERAR